jgi:hypothetical protein
LLRSAPDVVATNSSLKHLAGSAPHASSNGSGRPTASASASRCSPDVRPRDRTTNEWERDRQRVSRLQRAVKPREPAESFDPWELAYNALRELKSLHSVGMRAEHYERLERIAKAIRRLGWGPDDAPRATHVPRESPEPLLARLNPSEPI